MKVLLINPEAFHIKHKAAIPLGLLSIATYLEQHGHTVKLYDRTVDGGSLKSLLGSFSPDIAGVAAPAFKCFKDAVKVSRILRKRGIPVVWGGAIPSLIPETVLQSGVVDFVVRGEGELTFLDLINTLPAQTTMRAVDGLSFIENGEIVMNKDRDFADLADLPIIDFRFTDPKKYFVENIGCRKMLHVYASKGCVCQCTYCYNPYYSKCVWRQRPVEYYLSEIRYLVETCGMDGVCFADDLLSPNNAHLTALCDHIAESGIEFIWGGEFRADMPSEENLQRMYDTGCRWIYFGIESGCEQRQALIKKRLNLNKAKQVIENCREIGIVTSTSFILNYPDQTQEELRETVQYMKSLKADLLIPSFFGPIPKTELCDALVDEGRFTPPSSLREWNRVKMMDIFGVNYSCIPDRELKVVSSFFYCKNLFWKDPGSQSASRVNMKKALRRVFEMFVKMNGKSLHLIALSIKEVSVVLFYAYFFPSIRKKYDLYFFENNDNTSHT